MLAEKDVQDIRIRFELPAGPKLRLERFVYAYLLGRNPAHLIDCGPASGARVILDSAKRMANGKTDIGMVFLTHAHPDHIGGGAEIKQGAGPRFAAHSLDTPWIEDVELQFKERPVPAFQTLAGRGVDVDILLQDGDEIELRPGETIKALHTPGHARGHLSFLIPEKGLLFCGDAVPLPGTMPIYENVPDSIASIRRLLELDNVEALLSSWDAPCFGSEVRARLKGGLGWIQEVHDAVRIEMDRTGGGDPSALTPLAVKRLGLPDYAVNPLTAITISAHVKAARIENL